MNAGGVPRAADVDARLVSGTDVVPFYRLRRCEETWLLHAGGPLEIHLIHADGRHETRTLSLDAAPASNATAHIEAGSLRAARLAPGGAPATLVRSAASGEGCETSEVPPAAELLRCHPLHRGIILEMTLA